MTAIYMVNYWTSPAYFFGSIQYGSNFSCSITYLITYCAFTLFPAASSGGDTTAIPNFPGNTASNPPPTPLFAGSPVSNNQMPELSYKPAVAMTGKVYMT